MLFLWAMNHVGIGVSLNTRNLQVQECAVEHPEKQKLHNPFSPLRTVCEMRNDAELLSQRAVKATRTSFSPDDPNFFFAWNRDNFS